MQKLCGGSPLFQQPREHFPHWPSSGRIEKSGIKNMVLLPQFLYTTLLFCPSSQLPKVPKVPGWICIWEWYSGSSSAQGSICLKHLRDSESCNCGKVLSQVLTILLSLLSISNNSDVTSADCRYDPPLVPQEACGPGGVSVVQYHSVPRAPLP